MILPLTPDFTAFREGDSAKLPGKLAAAFLLLGEQLHTRFAIEGLKSRKHCILCSLAVRDFFTDIGYPDARVLSVIFEVQGFMGDQRLHSLAMGAPDNPHGDNENWNGHLIAVLPRAGWLIDSTLFQVQRKQWPLLPGMCAVPLATRNFKNYRTIATLSYQERETKQRVYARWLSHAANSRWSHAPDSAFIRRAPVVDFLTAEYRALQRTALLKPDDEAVSLPRSAS